MRERSWITDVCDADFRRAHIRVVGEQSILATSTLEDLQNSYDRNKEKEQPHETTA